MWKGGTDKQSRQEKHRLWSISVCCQRLGRVARRVWRSNETPEPAALGEIEQHLHAVSRLLEPGTDQAVLPARPASAEGVLELAQRMLQTEDQVLEQRRREPARGAPSAAHTLLLRGEAGLVPTPDFVAFLCQSHRSGILRVVTDAEVFSIEVEDGDIVHAHSDGAPAGERLGDILVEQGVLTEVELARLLADEQRTRFGSRVVEQQLVTRDELMAALETQIRRLFHRLFTTEPREFLFWGGPCLLAEQSMRLNVNMLLLDSARAADETARDLGV